jgi:hypothetical protein
MLKPIRFLRLTPTEWHAHPGAGMAVPDLTISSRDFNNQEYGFKPGVIKINPD